MIYRSIKAENLVRYIQLHGHQASVVTENGTVKIQATSAGQESPDTIEASFGAVREWLGY